AHAGQIWTHHRCWKGGVQTPGGARAVRRAGVVGDPGVAPAQALTDLDVADGEVGGVVSAVTGVAMGRARTGTGLHAAPEVAERIDEVTDTVAVAGADARELARLACVCVGRLHAAVAA